MPVVCVCVFVCLFFVFQAVATCEHCGCFQLDFVDEQRF